MFKSEAQKAKMAELVKQGKLPQATYDKKVAAQGNTKLPARVGVPAAPKENFAAQNQESLKNFGANPRPKTINELRAIAKQKLQK